ncbi:hypothetical protein [Actinomadura rugatobispora]|uniref:Uncharacterized protein n=1 Tax=Actinomadura rugatobispora TaxID=1994 RepID=A0ABW1A093_9ACTN|nr:hypothetical protein GCM10010200_007570 [Actinomadura rugatobispora]
MTGAISDLHNQARQRVHSLMTAAMRADPAALDQAASELDIDPYSREFVREARRLVLACGAALSAVLAVHRPGKDAHDQEVCRGCGTRRCHTLRHISEVFTAYTIRPVTIDRAEAWRRAESCFGPAAPAVAVEEREDCFIARPVPFTGDAYLLVVDRRTGALTRWPDMPSAQLVDYYRAYLRGEL